MNYTPMSLPTCSPVFTSRGLAPVCSTLRPSLSSSAMRRVEVVVPSPAKRLVAPTDRLMSVQTASLRRSC